MNGRRLQRLEAAFLTATTVAMITIWPPAWVVALVCILSLLLPVFITAFIDQMDDRTYKIAHSRIAHPGMTREDELAVDRTLRAVFDSSPFATQRVEQ